MYDYSTDFLHHIKYKRIFKNVISRAETGTEQIFITFDGLSPTDGKKIMDQLGTFLVG
jgi:hypothetical protein